MGSIREKKGIADASIKPLDPFVLMIQGDNENKTKFFSVVGRTCLQANSAVEALVLTLKIFLAYQFPFPKVAHNAWTVIQKICFN